MQMQHSYKVWCVWGIFRPVVCLVCSESDPKLLHLPLVQFGFNKSHIIDLSLVRDACAVLHGITADLAHIPARIHHAEFECTSRQHLEKQILLHIMWKSSAASDG